MKSYKCVSFRKMSRKKWNELGSYKNTKINTEKIIKLNYS